MELPKIDRRSTFNVNLNEPYNKPYFKRLLFRFPEAGRIETWFAKKFGKYKLLETRYSTAPSWKWRGKIYIGEEKFK